MKCDELEKFDAASNADLSAGYDHRYAYEADEVDAAIAELKAEIRRKEGVEQRWFERCMEERTENAKLKKKLENVQASMYADVVDANMEVRKLKKTLWVTRTAFAKSEKDRWNAYIDCGNRRNRKDPAYVKTGKLLTSGEWRKLWADNECKCLKKAEEYK